MDWLGLALALVKLLGAFTQWLHDRGMINAGKAEQVAAALKEQADGLKKAVAARESVRIDSIKHPERVRDDDGFRRD